MALFVHLLKEQRTITSKEYQTVKGDNTIDITGKTVIDNNEIIYIEYNETFNTHVRSIEVNRMYA